MGKVRFLVGLVAKVLDILSKPSITLIGVLSSILKSSTKVEEPKELEPDSPFLN